MFRSSALPGCWSYFAASAQTLQQAESLWKARRYVDANEVVQSAGRPRIPKNADYKVRWGRMLLEKAARRTTRRTCSTRP